MILVIRNSESGIVLLVDLMKNNKNILNMICIIKTGINMDIVEVETV